MQIKNNLSNIFKNPWIIGTAKLILLAGCIHFIFQKFRVQSIEWSPEIIPNNTRIVVLLVLLMMILNWYLETLRWKVSVEIFEPISMGKAWRVVLAGLALNWVLPFTSGDLLARISQQKDKYQVTAATVLNRSIMLIFTCLIGAYGVGRLVSTYSVDPFIIIILAIAIVAALIAARKRLHKFFGYFRKLTTSTIKVIVALSFLRYIVFVLQFYLLLNLFIPQVPTELLIAGIGWIFFVRSALPMLFGGAGVREASGIVFFEPYVSNLQLVVIPIFLIWLINTVIPSLVGWYFVWNTDIYEANQHNAILEKA